MSVEIRSYNQYKIFYSSSSHEFFAEEDGTKVESASTEKVLIDNLKVRDKSGFKRVPIYAVSQDGEVQKGELTSVVDGGCKAWVRMPDSQYSSGRSKIYLSSGRDKYFEQTEANAVKVEQVKSRGEQIKALLTEIKGIRETLEKPINLEYFRVEQGL